MLAITLVTALLSSTALGAPFFTFPGSGHSSPKPDGPSTDEFPHPQNGTHPGRPSDSTTNFPHSGNGTNLHLGPDRNETGFNHLLARADPVGQLISIIPNSQTCNGATFPTECVTASAAVGPLLASFTKYKIATAAEQVALLSWIGFESQLKFNQNHFPAPGRPGQGTRAMLMPNFVAEYAASIPQVASQIAGKDPAGILALVQPDQFSFGSAAWFYSTKCSPAVKQGVQTGGKAGWETFISQCVQTTVDEGRTASWERAAEALGFSTN